MYKPWKPSYHIWPNNGIEVVKKERKKRQDRKRKEKSVMSVSPCDLSCSADVKLSLG